MAAWRRAIELSLGDADTAKLRSIAQSRTEPASRVERARILLAYREDPSFFAVGRALGLHHQTVQRCVDATWCSCRPHHSSFSIEHVPLHSRLQFLDNCAKGSSDSLQCQSANRVPVWSTFPLQCVRSAAFIG